MADLKHHHIRFKESPGAGGAADWVEKLKKVNGVTGVKIDAGNKDVFVEYDLMHCCEEAIEHWMKNAGFTLDESFLERVKRGWIHYTEKNERDALGAVPRSCCDAGGTEGKKEAHPPAGRKADKEG